MLLAVLISLLLALVVAGLVVLHARRGRIKLPRRKRRLLPGGQPVPDDLAKDDGYTDDQQYLM